MQGSQTGNANPNSFRERELRCFIGLSVPNPVRKILHRECLAIQGQSQFQHFKWLKKQNYHLTLHFFGELPIGTVQILKQELKWPRLLDQPFELEIDSIGGFPTKSSSRFLVARVKQNTGLQALFDRIQEKMIDLGLQSGSPEPRPHITLGRLKRGFKAGRLKEISAPELNFTVDEFHLFRSTLTPEGSMYEILDTFRPNDTEPSTRFQSPTAGYDDSLDEEELVDDPDLDLNG
ncbi:MAG: RNA 2',3'-cyclic phosphodiesterase [Pseudomonadales bacterium]|nr:RNA 2',3'-cyclic phosphodiesterase [Pseudomonadales bacterium]